MEDKISLLELLEQEKKNKEWERDMKDKYYRHIGRLLNFIETIEALSGDFDDFCDCENKEVHHDGCLTLAMRRDVDKVREFER